MWTPTSPFELRMQELYRVFAAIDAPIDPILEAQLRVERERDIGFRIWFAEFKERFPAFLLSRSEGGTGFPVSNLLRHFFREYAARISEHGPSSFPTSFNVVESFLSFSHRFLAFDLREEKEHVLRLSEYYDWYTANSFPDTSGALADIMPEGVSHLYNFVAPADDFRLRTPDSALVLVGVALVRHASELSVIALLGESPPHPPDSEVSEATRMERAPSRAQLQPHPEYKLADRYLDDLPNFARVIPMVRFDIMARKYAVRYINLDVGSSYRVETDDPLALRALPRDKQKSIIDTMRQRLQRYDELLSSLASLIYLPAFFIDQQSRVRKTTFGTQLQSKRDATEVRKAIKLLGRSMVSFSRDVWFLENPVSQPNSPPRTINPPDLEFESSGFWRVLPPAQIGHDECGQPIVGKTWVERTDTWSTQKLESFVLSSGQAPVSGPNAGSIYVMRSASHGIDLYKIGMTKRTPSERAAELSTATGVPTPFEVLAKWDVGDVVAVEAEAHHVLKAYKVHKRREFFRAPLPIIIAALDAIATRTTTH